MQTQSDTVVLKHNRPRSTPVTVVTLFANGATYTFKSGKAKLSVDYVDAPDPKAVSIHNVDRIILHDDKNGSPLLVLDLIAGPESVATWSTGELKIDSAVRCYFQTSDHLILSIKCAPSGLATFGFKRKDDDKFIDVLSATGKETLADALKASEASPLVFKTTDKSQTFSSRFLFHLSAGFDLGGPNCRDFIPWPQPAPPLTLSFLRSTEFTAPYQQYFINIQTIIPHNECSHEFPIPVYLEESTDGLKYVDVNVNSKFDWRLTQRPSTSSLLAAAKSKAIPVESGAWIVEAWCVSPALVWRDQLDKKFNPCATRYLSAVRNVSGGLTASFVPQIDKNSLDGAPWTVIYQVLDSCASREYKSSDLFVLGMDRNRAGRSIIVQPCALIPGGPGSATATLAGYISTDGTPVQLKLALNEPILPRKEQLRGLVLCATSVATAGGKVSIRMGSLDLQLGSPSPMPHYSEWSLRCDANPFIHTDAFIAVAHISPGGQDDLPGEQYVSENSGSTAPGYFNTDENENVDTYIENRFSRQRPILIPRSGSQESGSFLLHVEEDSSRHKSRTLRFELLSAPAVKKAVAHAAKTQPLESVVVLDCDPFLVAQVEFPPLTSGGKTQGAVIAQWNNAGPDGPAWQIRTDSQPFGLYMAPQAVGESWIKNEDFNLPADFRLGYGTYLQVDNSYFQQRFGEVPWNLRRLLGYPGQRDAGVALRRLEFELLYGLSCDSKQPFVRLAEISALCGAIPGRVPPRLRWDQYSEKDSLVQDQVRKDWADIYARYLSRLAVLEPWDSHAEGSLILKDLSCELRYPQKNPKSQRPPADLADPIDPSSTPGMLQGGATWGFESRNVFNAVLHDPISTSASVSDLYLSTLGGWGHQQASFDKGRSTIFADVSMSRTYFYKLERIGRISCWWTRAKHVVVFARSVVASRQFYLEQKQDTYGVPLIRKVEEYIEFLDEERKYPDDKLVSADSPASTASKQAEDEKKAERRCGCVSAFIVPKGTRIKVSSAWGSDVGDIGWKVPLWKKGAVPSDVYPFPKLTLSLLSQFGESSQECPCDIGNPEDVYFYTDTREATGADPDTWGSIRGVDYEDLPRPKPRSDFDHGSTQQLTPADVPTPGGFGSCTFRLLPPLRPANIAANRVDKPMATVLDSITIVRAAFRDKEDTFRGDAAKLDNLRNELANGWKEVLVYAASVNFDPNQLLKQIDAQFDSWFQDYLKDYAALKGIIATKANDLQTKLKAYEDASIAKLSNQIRFGISQALADVSNSRSGTERILLDVDAAIKSLPAGASATQLKALVTAQFSAFQDAVLQANASPGLLGNALGNYVRAAQTAVASITQQVDACKSLLPDAGELPEPVRVEILARLVDLQNELTSLWQSAAKAQSQPWLPSLAETAESQILPTYYTEYVAKLDQVQRLIKLLQPGAHEPKEVLAGLTTIGAAYSQKALDEVAALAKDAQGYLADFLSGLSTIHPKCTHPLTWNDWGADAFCYLIDAAATGDPQKVLAAFKDLFDLTNPFQHNLSKQISAFENLLNAQLTKLQGYVTAQLSKGISALEEFSKDILKKWVTDNQAALQKALESYRDKTVAAAQEFFGRYIENLRLPGVTIAADPAPLLSLIRAFGNPPVAPGLGFARDKLAYFFSELPQIGITPSIGNLLEPSVVVNGLNALGVSLPTLNLGDRLIPPDLRNFDLSTIFPNFAGLDLKGLFQSLRVSQIGDNIRVSHGVDPQSKSAWAQADVLEEINDAPIFDRGPMSLRLAKASLSGSVRVEGGVGKAAKRTATGLILGDWKVLVSGQEIVTLRQTELHFDDAGGIRFNVEPQNVELPGVLAFLTDFLSNFGGSDSGLSVGLHDKTIEAILNLPIPDYQGATVGITNLRLGAHFGLGINDQGKFQLTTGFNLASRDKPFNLAIFILGGAGYIETSAAYVPSDGSPTCSITLGIMVSASLAIALGPLKGGVFVFFGVQASFSSGSGGGLTIGVVLLIRGEVSVLGFISASIALMLQVSYQGGQLIGQGRFTLEIKICWCFTFRVDAPITYRVGSGGSAQTHVQVFSENSLYAMAHTGESLAISDVPMQGPPPMCNQHIKNFVMLTQEN